ncbi:MAG: D-glycerate dehydrogenase [Candidatus Heimdallarchaeota archaeon]|nr:D-glycerate dehydrogenase [Candidatus Heimdallarchaeota archaeon]
MAKFKVFLTRRIPQPAIDKLLESNIDLELNEEDRVLTKEEIIEGVKGKDGLICLLTDIIDSEIMDHAGSQLKIIANYAVGYNNIDIPAANARNIPVTNTPGVLTDTTADFTMALLFAIARKIVISDKYTREGKFKGWGPLLQLGTDVYGKTMGIIGCGRIGSAVARRAAKGFQMKVLYYDTKRFPDLEKELEMEFCSLDKLLKTSDFISLHIPLTKETKYLIGQKELSKMKSSTFLINTSRGLVIDEKALVKALEKKQIAGAALDVYEHEPELTPGLAELDNVVVSAHIASASIETRTKMGMIAVENLLIGLNGKIPPNCINSVIYKQNLKDKS